MRTSASREETHIYEDVSLFLQAFKRAVAVCDAMSTNIDRGVQNTQHLATFCNLFEEFKALAQKYPEQGLYGLDSSAYSRFVYRLVEILLTWRGKYQGKSEASESPFHLFLKEMDAYLRECEKRRSFLSLVNCTQIILLKFANKILANTRSSTTENAGLAQKLGEISKRLREELGRLKVAGKLMVSKEAISQKIIQAEENSALLQKKEKMCVTNRVFADIQQGFDKLKGMDVDFAYFRASHFEAKNSPGSFYQSCLERNQLITNAITLFGQSFKNYAKRKEFKAGRQLLKTQRAAENMTLRHTEYDRSGETLSQFKASMPFHISSSQKLKNIYINLNKGKKRYEQSEEALLFPKTHGKMNKTFEERPNTLQFDSSYSNLIKDRIKTSPNHDQSTTVTKKHSNNPKVAKHLLTPKVLIKSKCFQMGGMTSTTKNEANIRITPFNKFSIRQNDRNKLVNWFSQK